MRLRSPLTVVLSVHAVGALLCACVSDIPGAPDGGDGGGDTGVDAQVVSDASDAATADAPDAPDAGPACDRMKPFGNPMAVTLQNDVNPVVAYSFKVRANGTHVYLQRSGAKLEQGLFANHTITFPGLLDVYTNPFQAGADVSGDELSMVFSTGGGLLRAARMALNGPFLSPMPLPITLPPLDASINQMSQVSLSPGSVAFSRSENSQGPQVVDVFEARANPDGGAYSVTNLSTLHAAGLYVGRSVFLDENHLYLTAWGSMGSPYQRIYFAARPNPMTPWAAPTATPIAGFTPKSTDEVVPLDVSPDDCTLYFGVSNALVDGPYAVYEARRPQ